MDIPRHQMTKEQRTALADWERRVAEAQEEEDKKRWGAVFHSSVL